MSFDHSDRNLLEEIDRLKGTSWLIHNIIEKYLRYAESLVLTDQEEKAFLKISRLRDIFTDFYSQHESFIKDLLQENFNYIE